MMRSLSSGVSAIQQFQGQLDVIGNNISNSNTIAFKSGRMDFADSFSQTLAAAGAGRGSNVAAQQIGSGVTTGGIHNQFTQGTVSTTGVSTDLALQGDGFFVVKDGITGAEYATRAGDFRLDASGNLVTNKGLRVQGYSDAGLTTRGNITVDGTGRPATADPTASVVSFAFDLQGRLNVRLSDGTEFVRGQVLLQRFNDPQALSKEGDNLYSGFGTAGALAQIEAPSTNGLGSVQAGALELSNVDLAGEFAGMITAQRGFQASARIITTSDEILQELVNLKR
ncbi:MAG: flagellar hook-basal body complex protein [Limisphaerales bacterium]